MVVRREAILMKPTTALKKKTIYLVIYFTCTVIVTENHFVWYETMVLHLINIYLKAEISCGSA